MKAGSERLIGWGVPLFVAVIQFVYLPFLGDVNVHAKEFGFLFFLFLLCSFLLWRARQIALPRIGPLLALFLMVLLLSSLQAFRSFDALIDLGCVSAGILFLLAATHTAYRYGRYFENLVAALLLSGVAAAALTLYQYCWYLHFGVVRTMLIPYLLPPADGMRVDGIYGQPNLFALFLVVCLLALVYRHLYTDFRPRSACLRGLGFLPFFLISLVFFLTQSRSGMISLGLTLAFAAYCLAKGFAPPLEGSRRRELLFLLVGFFLAYLLFKSGAAFLQADLEGEKLVRDASWFTRNSLDMRLVEWLSALLIFFDHPLLGVGLDNFKSFLAEYQLQALDILHLEFETLVYTRWPHNEYLQILCEGGVIAFLVVAIFLFLFFRSLFGEMGRQACSNDPQLFFCHLLILPFLIQAGFTYTFHFPPLCVLFLALSAFILSRRRVRLLPLGTSGRFLLILSSLVAFAAVLLLFSTEIRIGTLRDRLVDRAAIEGNIALFEELAENRYSEYHVLKNALPPLVSYALREEDQGLAERLLPRARRMVEIEGAYWQYYNLSRLLFTAGKKEEARRSIQKAIDRNPAFEDSWSWQHRLNLEAVAEKTGVPVETLIRRGQESLEELLRGDSDRKGVQGLQSGTF